MSHTSSDWLRGQHHGNAVLQQGTAQGKPWFELLVSLPTTEPSRVGAASGNRDPDLSSEKALAVKI